jgi:hypothetical protein
MISSILAGAFGFCLPFAEVICLGLLFSFMTGQTDMQAGQIKDRNRQVDRQAWVVAGISTEDRDRKTDRKTDRNNTTLHNSSREK